MANLYVDHMANNIPELAILFIYVIGIHNIYRLRTRAHVAIVIIVGRFTFVPSQMNQLCHFVEKETTKIKHYVQAKFPPKIFFDFVEAVDVIMCLQCTCTHLEQIFLFTYFIFVS